MLFVLFSAGSAEADDWWGENINGHLMASCIWNIRTTFIKFWYPSSSYDRQILVCFFMPHSVECLKQQTEWW